MILDEPYDERNLSRTESWGALLKQPTPLRKDFPLTGFSESRYNITKSRVVYENVELTQEYRTFECLSPWETYKKK